MARNNTGEVCGYRQKSGTRSGANEQANSPEIDVPRPGLLLNRHHLWGHRRIPSLHLVHPYTCVIRTEGTEMRKLID